MATTTSYSFNKPTVGGDTDSWGTQLNANWDKVDDLFDGTTTADGMVLTGANITATTVDISGTVTIADASITADDITTGPLTLTGEVVEAVHTLSGTTPSIDPANGTIQVWSLTGSSTPTFALASGESVTLRVTTNGNSITWPGAMKWIGGLEPTLDASDENWINLWYVGSTLYGAYAGASS